MRTEKVRFDEEPGVNGIVHSVDDLFHSSR